ncbi:MAG: hypothetical protein N2506_03960 [Dehalococcoidales bacterium]|nr:hypothetical protein [Dehalococcoidales bacterium]
MSETKTEKPWAEMTPEEKRAMRLQRWLNNWGNSFPDAKAEKEYRTRVKRLIDVYNVTEPDRVPVNLPVGNLPYRLAGVDTYTAMYDYEKAIRAVQEFNRKYGEQLEYTAAPYFIPGRVLEILDYKIYAWAGHGIAKDGTQWQFIEGEYMTADEYDDLIRDPSDFWLRKYLPRVFGTLAPMKLFQPVTNITENVHVNQFMPLALPEVQEMLQKMLEAGREYQRMQQAMAKASAAQGTSGFFGFLGGFAKAPFDTLGDTLRGTTQIMKDMFRYPQKLLKALDVVAELQIATVLKSPNADKIVTVHYPLHKGADGWMSQKQFETFYWPSLKKVMDAFIKEGIIQILFAEGSYNTRLAYVADQFPKGTVVWYFDRTDMSRAKQLLGKNYCLQGNVPSSLLVTGEPGDVKEYCRKLIEECGKGGGFILSAGCVPDNPKLENLFAMMEAVREYGWYRR